MGPGGRSINGRWGTDVVHTVPNKILVMICWDIFNGKQRAELQVLFDCILNGFTWVPAAHNVRGGDMVVRFLREKY